MRLIDADALKELRHDFIQGRIKFDGNEYDLIDKCPTTDAVEVVHGRWVGNGIPESMLSKCSVCGFPCGACTFNFCPNCGAKMDGERREP